MVGNQSGPRNGQNPWRSSEQGPPDLLALLKKFVNKFNRINGSGQASSQVANWQFIGFGFAIILVIWFLSGIFLLSPVEEAAILRFGQYQKTLGPGPHWIPRFIDSKYVVNTQKIDSFPYESEMLTRDENIVSVGVQIQYRIGDLKQFLFNVVNPTDTLHQAVSSAVRQIVGQMDLDAILTTGREELAQKVNQQLRETLELYKLGITIRDVALQSTRPPEAVTAAFDDVIKAREDKQRFVNQAQSYAKKVVLVAQGRVARIEQEADAYQYAVLAQAQGSTARYLALLKAYLEAPGITKDRLYLDTLTTVLSRTSNIVIDSPVNNLLYLPLDQLLRQKNVGSTKLDSANEMSVINDRTDWQKNLTADKNIDGDESDRPAYSEEGDRS